MFQGRSDSIVERGLPDRMDTGEGYQQLIRLISEWGVCRKTERYPLVEVDHKHLVLRIAGAGERHCRCNHVGALGAHTSAVVHNNAGCDGDIFVAEVLDRLEDSIFVKAEIIFP